jgi:hypothetical protein
MKSLALIAALGSVSLSLAAEETNNKLTADLKIEAASKYIWRGINLENACVLQPSLSLNYQGFTATIWGNMDLTNYNGTWYDFSSKPAGKFTEWDASLQYTHQVGPVKATVGFVDYQFPYQGYNRTEEVYASLGWSGCADVTLSGYLGVLDADGFYSTLGVSKAVSKLWGAPLVVSAQAGYGDKKHNSYYYNYNKNGFTDALFSISAEFNQGKGYTITPYLKYSTLLDDKIFEDDTQRDNLIGGVVLGFKF